MIKLTKLLFIPLFLFLTSCASVHRAEQTFAPRYVTEREVYHPGYYQEPRFHGGYVARGYYDYLGNYHAEQRIPHYYEPGRWVHSFLIETDVNIKNY